jgi:predicted lipase
MFFVSLLLILSLFINNVSSYDPNEALRCVWLSGAAYCGKDKYYTMKVGGPATGLVVQDILYDKKTDLQGYTGTLSKYSNIYVVIRGSSSVMNWLDDFEVRKVPYITYPECGCQVHNGFYKSATNVKNDTVAAVKRLKSRFPSYSVIVTGHSYGASCSQLLAMELEKAGISTTIYNYGQPRVGDTKYAGFANTIVPNYWRFTHNKDVVPHVPPTEMGYLHSCREVFEDANGYLNLCSDVSCEDPKCADQYPLSKTNADDHTTYLNHPVSCSASTV